MNDNKWLMHRAGLVNFWYYSDEEYQFANGKLLLRGLNGSGKSVTMQSLITVLLDGKITANRLDPFGSRDRRMEDYLLGEKDVVDRDERTGYLYLEYKREHSEQYFTTGIGLKARRGASLDFWGFVITDNRRVKHDFHLLKTEFSAVDGREEKIPLTRPELERQIGAQGGFVVRSQGEYAALVNKYIFGFANMDSYKDLMELLIQLRSPKLSKDFKPSVIHEILTESLPPLSDEELRPLSDTIENMEQTKQQIEELARDQAALSRLNRQYREYSAVVLAEKARAVIESEKNQQKIEQTYHEKIKEREDKTRELAQVQAQSTAYEQEQEVLVKQKAELESHDVFRIEEKKQTLEIVFRTGKQRLEAKEAVLQGKKQSEIREKALLAETEHRLDEAETVMLEVLESLGELAEQTEFANHQNLAGAFEKNYSGEYSFAQWRQEQNAYQHRVDAILAQIHTAAAAKRAQQTAAGESERVQMEFDTARAELRRDEQDFFDSRQDVLEKLYRWIEEYRGVLPLEAGAISSVAGAARQLYENSEWTDVKAPIESAYKQHEDDMRMQKLHIEDEIEKQESERRTLTIQLAEWRNLKEPEPPRHPALAETRKRLLEANIPFIPFYAAVEFKPSVSAGVRERIETVMTELNLLDALIVTKQCLNKLPDGVVDRIIYPEPAILCVTLADYLVPTPPEASGVQAGDIDEVLRSIVVSEVSQLGTGTTGAAFPELSVQYGTYRSGILAGRAPLGEQARYIGKEARRRHREQEMARLEQEIFAIEGMLTALTSRKQTVAERMTALAAALAQFPSVEQVKKAYDCWCGKQQECALKEKDVARKNDLLRAAINAVQSVLNQLRQMAEGLTIALTEESYGAVCRLTMTYREALHELELARQTYLHSLQNAEQTRRRLAEVGSDVDELRGECLVLADELKKQALELQSLQELLVEMGAEEMRRRSYAIIERLRQLPELQKSAAGTIAKLEFSMQQLERQLPAFTEQRFFAEQLYACCQTAYAKEAGLRLAVEDTLETIVAPQDVLAQYDNLSDLDRTKSGERLSESYYREQAVLVEYRMELDDLFADEEVGVAVPQNEEYEIYQRQINSFRQLVRRKRVTVEYDGRRMSPQAALVLIERHITEQQAILSEQDRILYEEVIMNSIGRVISRRINNAEKWVAQMNALMESLDTSSGLSFSLQWKPHTANDDEQLDTQELVGLLRADHRLLKEEDLKRVVRHFQSRIAQAKALAATKAVSFQLLVKDMLDFRQWFAFNLYYRREGMPKKELTNSVFGKFSGGEKAMAMYTPLFSAVYSRYKEAKADAPRVISLDEAFAGVDENNIREMFDLVEKMGFNYIINSQSLWGDYDTVRRLSICELVRPKNAPFVTIVRYLWDGNVRRLLDDEVD